MRRTQNDTFRLEPNRRWDALIIEQVRTYGQRWCVSNLSIRGLSEVAVCRWLAGSRGLSHDFARSVCACCNCLAAYYEARSEMLRKEAAVERIYNEPAYT